MSYSSTTIVPTSANYNLIAPLSMSLAIVAVIFASLILILVLFTKQLHTVSHLLICNTCIASIFYCCAQCNNYIYLLFFPSDTSDRSCQLRAYFSYMSIVAVVYSYLLQAISRFFFAVLSTRYRWLTSFKTHSIMIAINWLIVIIVPSPSILTKDIYFRPGYLCWIPQKFMLHILYSIIAYYLIPISITVTIYGLILYRIRRTGTNALTQGAQRKNTRDLEVLRNIMILFGIYIVGGTPSVFFILSGISIFYSIGVVSVSLAVAVEKFCSILLDRELRKVLKKLLCQSTTQVVPFTNNTCNMTK